MYFSEHIQIFQQNINCVHVRNFHLMHRWQNTRFSAHTLDLPFRNTRFGKKTLSCLGPILWNTLPSQIKLRRSVNTFKHDFDKLQKENDDIFITRLKLMFFFIMKMRSFSTCICHPCHSIFRWTSNDFVLAVG